LLRRESAVRGFTVEERMSLLMLFSFHQVVNDSLGSRRT
jgi:hypothetical protein